jgi:OTT_1508-like deaminase
MDHIKQRATSSEQNGSNQSPFADVRHYVGRLESHVRNVRILISAALRLPVLFVDPEIEVVHHERISILPPELRKKTTLREIANRMIGNDNSLLLEIQKRLQELDQTFDIEHFVRAEYEKKNFKPRVHAELTLLEHFYRNGLDFAENDPYIGCSKPACYCCSLYFRSHPGQFVEPASHQKIYLNWMPPTSNWDVPDSSSRFANHERDMLNKMVESIRLKTIEQIKIRTGRRPKRFDSVTGDTSSAIGLLERLRLSQDQDTYSTEDGLGMFITASRLADTDKCEEAEYDNENEDSDTTLRNASLSSEISLDTTESGNDSDDDGGVSLL